MGDLSYAGFGAPWKAMLAVQSAKFKDKTPLAKALLATGDAFLLAHASVTDLSPESDNSFWSDNSNGEGMNLLGLQLMMIRDRLSGVEENPKMRYFESLMDLNTGKAHTAFAEKRWRDIILTATMSFMECQVEHKQHLQEA